MKDFDVCPAGTTALVKELAEALKEFQRASKGKFNPWCPCSSCKKFVVASCTARAVLAKVEGMK